MPKSMLLVFVVAGAGLCLSSHAFAQVSFDARMRGGRIHYDGGRYLKAEEQFREALDAYGTNADTVRAHILIWLGLSEARVGELDSARTHLAAAHAVAPAMTERLKTEKRWTDLMVSLDPDKAGWLAKFDAAAQNGAQTQETALVPFEQDGKWGYKDKAGKVVIAPKYDTAQDFSGGRSWVGVGPRNAWNGFAGKYGLIDGTGNYVVTPAYDLALPFSGGFAAVDTGVEYSPMDGSYSSGKWGFIDTKGREVVPLKFAGVRQFSEGLAAVNIGGAGSMMDGHLTCSNGKWGFVDGSGSPVIPTNFDIAESFSEGLAAVAAHGRWQFVPEQGNYYVDGKWGFVDRPGKIVISPMFSEVRSFSGGLAAVRVGGGWTRTESEGPDESPELEGGQWGYIDKTGQLVIRPQYDAAGNFSNGVAEVENEGKKSLIDRPATEALVHDPVDEASRLPGPTDVKRLKDESPKSEVSVWKIWAIVRDPVSESGDMCAQILRWENGEWKSVANTTEGLFYSSQVRDEIPALDADGARALGLFE